MFNRKNLNDLFREFDSMFGGFDSMFGVTPNNGKTESGTDEFGDWTKETYKSPDGGVLITSFVRTGGNYKPNQSSGTTSLKKKLQIAIEEENFEEAVKLRDEIKNLETNQETITKLEEELKQTISDHNFERSIEIRDELTKLKK